MRSWLRSKRRKKKKKKKMGRKNTFDHNNQVFISFRTGITTGSVDKHQQKGCGEAPLIKAGGGKGEKIGLID